MLYNNIYSVIYICMYFDDEKEWILNGYKILDNKYMDNEYIIEFY